MKTDFDTITELESITGGFGSDLPKDNVIVDPPIRFGKPDHPTSSLLYIDSQFPFVHRNRN